MTNSSVLVLGATGMTDALLVSATIATGLIAGLFFTYANDVMPVAHDGVARAMRSLARTAEPPHPEKRPVHR